MWSSKRPPRSLPSSPIKSPIRRYTSVTSVTPTGSSSHKKVLPKANKITKSQSEAGLASSFRKLSVTPSPKPPGRSKSTSPRKPRSGQSISTTPVTSVEDVVNLIKDDKCRNVIVMAGAGISTPSGIPDFRTPGTGLYDNLQQYNIPEPTAIFDIEFFWYDPRPFFCLAKTLYPGNYQPNYVHYFVKMLHDRGVLLRMYTQNIDGLERLAGVPADKLVEAHGTFSTASCIKCCRSYDGDEIRKIIEKDEIPRCSTPKCRGVIKPDVVFFGEDLPKKFYSYGNDFKKCDLLLVMGTSLEVEPFAGIVNEASRSTPRVLINREAVGPFIHPWRRRPSDVIMKGDIVTSVKRLATLLDWAKDMDVLIEAENEAWQARKPMKTEGQVSDNADTETRDRDSIIDNKDKRCAAKPLNANGVSPNGVKKYHTLSGPQVPIKSREPIFRAPRNIFSRTIASRSSQAFPGNGTSDSTQNEKSIDCKPLYSGDLSKPSVNNRFMNSINTNKDTSSRGYRMPLLPFRYTHRGKPEERNKGDYRSIDMSKDLASAGIGLPSGRGRGSVRCFLSLTSDSDGESSSSSDSEKF